MRIAERIDFDMKKTIVVLDADEKQCWELCNILEERQYRAIPMPSLERMESYVHDNTFEAVIMDINTVPVDNQAIKRLTKKYPNSFLFFLSKDRFYPYYYVDEKT